MSEISQTALWTVIIGLGIGSFSLRFMFTGLIGDRNMPEWLLRHLRYTAVAILPGLVAGDRQRRVLEAKAQRLGKSFAEVEAMAFSYTSIREYVTPEQIADQILYLASERGKAISGQAISVCGDTQMLA